MSTSTRLMDVAFKAVTGALVGTTVVAGTWFTVTGVLRGDALRQPREGGGREEAGAGGGRARGGGEAGEAKEVVVIRDDSGWGIGSRNGPGVADDVGA